MDFTNFEAEFQAMADRHALGMAINQAAITEGRAKIKEGIQAFRDEMAAEAAKDAQAAYASAAIAEATRNAAIAALARAESEHAAASAAACYFSTRACEMKLEAESFRLGFE